MMYYTTQKMMPSLFVQVTIAKSKEIHYLYYPIVLMKFGKII